MSLSEYDKRQYAIEEGANIIDRILAMYVPHIRRGIIEEFYRRELLREEDYRRARHGVSGKKKKHSGVSLSDAVKEAGRENGIPLEHGKVEEKTRV
jgi:hypothetical protein